MALSCRLLRAGIASALLVATLLLACSAPAQAAYAPIDQPGPPLDVASAALRSSLACSGSLAGVKRAPVLLVPGTTLTPQIEFSWNYEPALRAQGIPYCAVTLPNNAMSDIQVSAEYVVYAIRTMRALSGRKIAIIGHSQGGMLPRFALRFWPDTRADVDDLIGLAPSNHGTLDADGLCAAAGGCAPSIWQQRSEANSKFLQALNSDAETFAGISYTVVYTHDDEVVVPNFGATGSSSSLSGGGGTIANVAIQDVCPNDTADHNAAGTYDPVSYALAIDALDHPGPADPARVSPAVCAQPFMPGVNAATFASDYQTMLNTEGTEIANYPKVAAEPPLKCYVTASCAGHAAPGPASCILAAWRLHGARLGPIRLGMTRAAVRRRLARLAVRGRRYADFFCSTRGGIAVGYAAPGLLRTLSRREARKVRGTAVLILTSNRHFALRGVHPGASLATARRRLKLAGALHIGGGLWFLVRDGRSRGVVRVRHGVVQEVGVALDALTGDARTARRLLTGFR